MYIGPYVTIYAVGGVTIGSGTIIGPRLTVYTANHRFRDAHAIPYDDIVLPERVEIGENVWIGGNVIVVPGVTIGEGCIVAAGSVVTKEFLPLNVLGGNPAKVIGTRNSDHYVRLKREKRIYLALKRQGLLIPHVQE
ncbi:MAG: acyltransferase [Anaerolineae bacterium]|nr:acyltransferase [Anaerolineae bacterium]